MLRTLLTLKVFDFLLAIFVAGCALFYLPGQTFGDAQIDFFKVGVCVLFVVSSFVKPRRNVLNPWINAYLGLATLVLYFLPTPAKAVMIAPFVHLFLAVVLFYLVANYLSDRSLIYKAIAVVVLINLGMVVLQMLGQDPVCLNDQGARNSHLVGLFGYKMNLGAYAAMAVTVFAGINVWLLAFVSFFLLVASKSWGAWLAAYVGLTFYAGKWKPKLGLVLVVLGFWAAIAGVVVVNRPGFEEVRKKVVLPVILQKPMIEVAFRSPYTGYGMGTIPYIYEQERAKIHEKIGYDLGSANELWNDYLESAVTLGFGATIILFLLIRRTWRILFSRKAESELWGLAAALLTAAVGMMFHSYVNFPNVGVLALVLLAMFEIKQREVAGEN